MTKIYAVQNILSGRNATGGLFTYPTDTMASVELAEQISKSKTIRLDESRLYCIGTYDEELQQIKTEGYPTVISWDMRRLKEAPSEEKTREEVQKDLTELSR